jgi:DNA polymerase-3 subunit epsilon
MKFIAIDFETANSERNSPCEIGIVKVENFEIIEKKSFLIRPKDNYFEFYNTFLHGIDEMMVKNEPEFDEIFEQIRPDFEQYPIVAHNASFDISVLRQTLDLYKIEYPETKYSCTYKLSREILKGLFSFKLSSICRHFGIKLKHHRALSDAEACAEIAIRIFQENSISNFEDISQNFSFQIGQLSKGVHKPFAAKSSTGYKISELKFNDTNFKPENPFYDQTVVFTGALQSMVRMDAQKKVLEIGGKCGIGVTSDTNFLIVGEYDYQKYGEGFKSSKIQKAEKYLSQGKAIELLTESQFLEMINNE